MTTKTLPDRMRAMRRELEEQFPEEAVSKMHRHTEELGDSGIAEAARGEGDPTPPFELPDTTEEIVRSEQLLEAGPLVLVFYRGVW